MWEAGRCAGTIFSSPRLILRSGGAARIQLLKKKKGGQKKKDVFKHRALGGVCEAFAYLCDITEGRFLKKLQCLLLRKKKKKKKKSRNGQCIRTKGQRWIFLISGKFTDSLETQFYF